jgi:predicted TIM-barrel enzyme
MASHDVASSVRQTLAVGSLAGLLPFADANAVVVEMAAEVLPVVHRTPVIAGQGARSTQPLDRRCIDGPSPRVCLSSHLDG